jgi:hypothetical protein
VLPILYSITTFSVKLMRSSLEQNHAARAQPAFLTNVYVYPPSNPPTRRKLIINLHSGTLPPCASWLQLTSKPPLP